VTSEPTSFLYPFIEAEERDATSLIADLAGSARAKVGASRALRAATLAGCAEIVAQAGAAMAERFERGGRLFAFGNGGSATDADGTVELFRSPPSGRPLPAVSLVDDRAVLTALANDVGFELVFSRQLIAHARPDDIAVGFSTSGDSLNLLQAFAEASRRGLLTVGLCGYEGGAMATGDTVEHCLVVRSDSVHRIQEAQDALVLELWSTVQRCLEPRSRP
jgi:D-sedoheptulose 7-phosphate isomerase